LIPARQFRWAFSQLQETTIMKLKIAMDSQTVLRMGVDNAERKMNSYEKEQQEKQGLQPIK
jgi:FtsZ-binding cell division protein ZapB